LQNIPRNLWCPDIFLEGERATCMTLLGHTGDERRPEPVTENKRNGEPTPFFWSLASCKATWILVYR
jgi:hypothetical protein